MSRASRLTFLLLIAAFAALPASAQVQTGTPPFGSFAGGPDILNLANLNSHITVPILNKPGRGLNFTYDLSYDTSVWYLVGVSGSQSWQPITNFGWRGQTEAATGYISYSQTSRLCFTGRIPTGLSLTDTNWVFHDAWGVPHPFTGTTRTLESCPGTSTSSFSSTANDGSGYTIDATGGTATILSTAGKVILSPANQTSGAASGTDRNGNQISVGSSGVFTDTLATTALTVAGVAPNPTTFTYTAPSGASAAYTMKYSALTVQTKFACSGITEYGPTSNNLVTEIDLPDIAVNPNDKYIFTYEPTPGVSGNVTGRLKSVTLPTGGTISYAYAGANNGIVCADGSAAGLTRTTPDGTWTYARSIGSGAASTTTVTDPTGNDTVVYFQGIYEVERQFYQGSHTSGTLLEAVNTCYNASASPCTGTAITLPITQRNITTVLPNNKQSEHDDFWNTFGGATETDDYDFGTAPHGALLKKTLATYATLGNITAFRQTVTVQDGNGNTFSKINYNYDETTPTATSGTPQLVAVTGPRGNLTSVNTYTNSTTQLTKSTTYYDTGNPNTTTDVNSGVTTFHYASGAPSCSNSFPTSVTEAISTLSTSMTWNCTGGVQFTSTDENSQTTTTTYNDPYFWRPASVADPTGATTSFCYGMLSGGTCSLNQNQSESYLTFNSNISTVDELTTLDGLGRSHVQQTRQGPAASTSTFDSVETDYDALGRVSRVTLPYSGTAGQTNSTVGATTTAYDAMGRRKTVSDSGGGSSSYSYGQANDVLITRNPAPQNENVKSRQFEYDGLGRLSSVCEVTAGTSSWPGGKCAQTAAQTGYWTNYIYDPVGNLKTVTQNAQSTSNQQTRTYAYDWMNRILSETVPEIGTSGNGSATYIYDSDSTCGTYNGDLVKRVDAAGNVICSSFDKLHRTLTTTYPSGSYASVTPQKNFVYDTATVNGVAMQNPKARLVEAYTCFAPCTTKLTDIGLSYTVRGENSDVYESTPNSGTYYHVAQTYWANRAANQLTGNIGLPATITYTPDGEGRVNSVSASSGQSPVISGTLYSTAGLPTTINLGSGSGDADTNTYDPNTNRMTQYKFTVNGTSLTSALGWNANGTLQTQNITDGFNSADTQNCSYGYDDITRVTSANCGSAAAQTFSYDPFGNINKSGSPYSFQPTYSTSTNRVTLLISFTPTYDSNGNLMNDNVHNYAWDSDGHPITIDAGLSDAVSLTYDALGRMVEQKRGSTYTQIAYSPVGQKLALMSGQNLQKAMVPLSGKAFALYNSSGLLYYAHPDRLGSIRLGTTPARAMYFDVAYAPFGETYAASGGTSVDPSYTGQMADTAHRQDTSGGLYDFPAREYSTQGRWPSPDPLGKGATCPKDPQTQNRYAYVGNNPLSFVDPSGTVRTPDGGFGGGGGGCDPVFDPFCGGCDTLECGGCDPTSPFCGGFPGGGGGGGGGGGFLGPSNPPQPRPFPWLQLPLGIFNSLELSVVPGEVCSCALIKDIAILFGGPQRQGYGCGYVCACSEGLLYARSAPNEKVKCQAVPCPEFSSYRPKPGPGPIGSGTLFGGKPIPWCN